MPHSDIRIEARCGHGGTAIVYRATQARTGRPLAVKVLRPDRLDLREAFVREANLLWSIDSPWVVDVEHRGTLPDGRPWFGMEYLPGPSLLPVSRGDTIVEGAQVVQWLQQVCLGLAAIHRRGWVHRDVKPSNLMLTASPGSQHIKVVDLGIAERVGVRPCGLRGTPEYIAPEQALNEIVDVRSDVYALGGCAYALVTGRPPVSGSTDDMMIAAHVDGVRVDWPDDITVPAVLRRIIERCLARSPRLRPPSMVALSNALEGARRAYAAAAPRRIPAERRAGTPR